MLNGEVWLYTCQAVGQLPAPRTPGPAAGPGLQLSAPCRCSSGRRRRTRAGRTEIRFDTVPTSLSVRGRDPDRFHRVGGGHQGEQRREGLLSITNLRLIWICSATRAQLVHRLQRRPLVNIHTANSRLRGNTQLYVMTKFNNSRFEFVHQPRRPRRALPTVQAVYRAYDTSRLYRDLKARGASGKAR